MMNPTCVMCIVEALTLQSDLIQHDDDGNTLNSYLESLPDSVHDRHKTTLMMNKGPCTYSHVILYLEPFLQIVSNLHKLLICLTQIL